MLLHPLVFLANAKWFSMQMKYSAFFGIAAKVVTGVFILKILLQKQVPLRWASASLIFYVIFIFYGFNQTVEYTWSLVTYESNFFYLLGILFLLFIDKALISSAEKQAISYLIVVSLGLLFLVLMATEMKLLISASILIMLPMIVLEKEHRRRIVILIAIQIALLVIYKIFLQTIGEDHGYEATTNNIGEVMSDLPANMLRIGYGLAAGVLNDNAFHYPTTLLTCFAVLFLVLVTYALFSYYKEKMWRESFVPIVLVIFMLLSMVGAIVFRSGEVATGWPLSIPRYFVYYHLGWVGIVWIFFIKFRSASSKLASFLLIVLPVIGMLVLSSSATLAWNNRVYFAKSNERTEIALCRYARNEAPENEISQGVRGSGFTREGVEILVSHKLNIFSTRDIATPCGLE